MESARDSPVPRGIRSFIDCYLDSVESVRLVLLLHDHAERVWSVEELASELRSSDVSIEKRLRALYERKLLRPLEPPGDRHGYNPFDADVARGIEEFKRYEQAFPNQVIDAIYSGREDSIREFSNAFSFKKEK